MINRNRVTSDLDTEMLGSEDYLTYILLAQIAAGRLALEFTVVDANLGVNLNVFLHPPKDCKRRYAPEPSAPLPDPIIGALAIELLADGEAAFMHLTIFVTLVDNTTGNVFGPFQGGLLVNLELEAEETDGGLERNHALQLSLVCLDDATTYGLELIGVDPAAVEDIVRTQLDQTFPLGIAQGQRIQQIRMRKFVNG